MNTLLKSFSQNLNNELAETDFSSIYEDIDILGGIKEYDELIQLLEDTNFPKEERNKIQKEFNKIERNLLTKNKLIKLKGEDKNYYCLRNQVYDNVGILVTDNYIECLEDDNFFYEYYADSLYKYMQNLLDKKINKYLENEDWVLSKVKY